MSEKTRSNVLTIAPGRPFLDLLARGLLAETADDPLRLSDYLVLLPTRRACRALQGAFLRQSDGRALLLPRLAPLGDIDDDELALTAFSEAAASGLAAVADLPPPVSETSRRLTLARMILEMADPSATEDGPMGADQALLLATELARLVDQVQAEKLSFDSLQALVPEDFAAHWQKTLDLLRHVYETWPKFLEAEGAMDPVARRIRVTETLIALWRTDPPRAPVIAAGSTGSVPVTADLLAAVARLPQGRVVLPGLDRHLDDDAWAALEPSHPQYNLAALLARFELSRADIGDWPVEAAAPPVA
ncbi:MAG: double-strand break repair protein AddB, partial [Alphaproteobacteria bacterium]